MAGSIRRDVAWLSANLKIVMPGLVPGIHVFDTQLICKGLDGQDKARS